MFKTCVTKLITQLLYPILFTLHSNQIAVSPDNRRKKIYQRFGRMKNVIYFLVVTFRRENH